MACQPLERERVQVPFALRWEQEGAPSDLQVGVTLAEVSVHVSPLDATWYLPGLPPEGDPLWLGDSLGRWMGPLQSFSGPGAEVLQNKVVGADCIDAPPVGDCGEDPWVYLGAWDAVVVHFADASLVQVRSGDELWSVEPAAEQVVLPLEDAGAQAPAWLQVVIDVDVLWEGLQQDGEEGLAWWVAHPDAWRVEVGP